MNKILLIEDDDIGAMLLQRMCEEAGVCPSEFKSVKTHAEGLVLANEDPAPDLIFADLNAPPVGEQECITTYIPAYNRRSPVIVWTGSSTPDIVIQCHAAGAHSCLVKQNLNKERCGTERLSQAVSDSILNWRRENAIRG